LNRVLLNIDWSFFDHEFMDDKVSDYLWFAGIILVTLLLKKPVALLLARISSSMASRFNYLQHRDTVRDMLFKPIDKLLQVMLFYIAIHKIDGFLDHFDLHRFIGRKVNFSLSDIIDNLLLFLFILFLTQVLSRFMDFIYYLRLNSAQAEKNFSRQQLLPLVKEMSKLLLWIMSIFWIMGSVFHVNIPALITGLGIGGVAIALAGKATVENFFAALTVLSDKPFQTGDVIKIGDTEGMVERIGFRSTRLRNVDGSAHIIPNQNLVSQNLINLSSRDTRGMKVIANIKYGINAADLGKLINNLKEILINIQPIISPIDIYTETFDKETFQLVINYHLPHPLPGDDRLLDLKKEINLRIFEVISTYAQVGTPVGTS